MEFWIPGGGLDGTQGPLNWGDNPIANPEKYVFPDGDIFFAINNVKNKGKNIEIGNLTITLVVETSDGDIKTYGGNISNASSSFTVEISPTPRPIPTYTPTQIQLPTPTPEVFYPYEVPNRYRS